QPRAGLEDRVIQSLRVTRARRSRISPAIVRAVSGVAAVIVVAATGYVVTNAIDNGGFSEMGRRIRSASNVRQIGQAVLLYSNDDRGAYAYARNSDFTNAPSFNLQGGSQSNARGLFGSR